MKCLRSSIGIVLIALIAACSGGNKKLQLGGTCTLNTDCKDPLVCKLGACHQACTQSRDCASGERCVLVDNIGVCQLVTEAPCAATSPRCQTPLVCAPDNMCRNSCATLADCLRGQECLAGVCLESNEATNWRADSGVARSDGGNAAGQDAGAPMGSDALFTAGDGGAATGPEGGTVADAPAPTTSDVATSSNADGAALGDGPTGNSTGGASGSTDGPLPPDLRPTDWGPAPSDASITVTAVAEPISARAGEEITILVSGVGVSNPKNLTLGGVLADKVTITDSTSVSFKAKLSVPHGLAPGLVNLGFSCQAGQATGNDVLMVQPISVSIDGVDTNRGTPENPFRTVSKAIQTAGTGDTIQVGSGTFSEGETWPKLPKKVKVLGEGAKSTILTGSSTTAFRIGLEGDVTIINLGLAGMLCGFGVSVAYSNVVLENIAGNGCTTSESYSYAAVAIYAAGAQVTLSGTETSLPTGVLVDAKNVRLNLLGGRVNRIWNGSLSPSYDLRIENATLGDLSKPPLNGVVLGGYAVTVTLDQAIIEGGLWMGAGTSLHATNTTFRAPSLGTGVNARGEVNILLTNCLFEGGRDQLWVGSRDTVTVRGCRFTGYSEGGVFVDSSPPAKLDLGTASESGGNEFSSTRTANVYGLNDQRTDVGPTITVSGTKFNGVTPPAGVVTTSATTAACEPGAYCIKTVGNSITFY